MHLRFWSDKTSIKFSRPDSNLRMSDVEEFVEYTCTYIYHFFIGIHEKQLNTGRDFLTINV
jgi:hypothetical protein